MEKVKRFFLPVPIFPGYIALFFFNLTTYGIVRYQSKIEPLGLEWPKAWLHACRPALIIALFLYASTYAVNKVLKQVKKEKLRNYLYYLGILVISTAYTYSQALSDPELLHLTGRAYLRNYVHIFLIFSIIGNIYLNINREVEAKRAALTLVQAQNKVLIESEERSRATVANFLHDRVQTALVTVTMQLAEIAKKTSATERSKLNSIIAEMEHIRGVDVRTAAQRLSPDLSIVGLAAALQLSADAVKPTIRSKFFISNIAKEWAMPDPSRAQLHLGIYRIAEQAIINAAVHGRAKNIQIFMDVNQSKNTIILDVINDGQAVAENILPGSGTAITSGWLSILNGTSSLSNTEDGKVKFHLEVPSQSSFPGAGGTNSDSKKKA
jgi:signal transduction histidine kinase